jgi:hypothetical protein
MTIRKEVSYNYGESDPVCGSQTVHYEIVDDCIETVGERKPAINEKRMEQFRRWIDANCYMEGLQAVRDGNVPRTLCGHNVG